MLGPTSQLPLNVRVATMADVPFIDALQKQYHKQLGFFPRGQMEEYIAGGNVLVAEGASNEGQGASSDAEVMSNEGQGASAGADALVRASSALLAPCPTPLITRLGYVASRDRYLKRDELGAIFQMCVAPGAQRKFIAATLLQAVFDRAPYGCKLYCCWCAQDLEANKFWEAMGFVPLAFRAGGKVRVKAEGRRMKDEKEGDFSSFSPHPSSLATARVHIFWQKRIRADDKSTPYWFPSQTTGGAIGAGRIVLPIPAGTHWSDAMPLILPGSEERSELREESGPKRLPKPKQVAPKPTSTQRGPISGLSFIRPPQPQPAPEAKAASSTEPKPPKSKAPRPKAAKNDPKLIAAARELRDRWLEQVNSGEAGGLVPQIAVRYDVRREIGAMKRVEVIDAAPVRLLDAA